MLIFKSEYDLQQLSSDHPFNRIMREHLTRTGHLEGQLILIQQGDTTIHLPQLKGHLADISWEGVAILAGFYHAVYLTNNGYALEFIIPDKEWLPAEIRANLDHHLVLR